MKGGQLRIGRVPERRRLLLATWLRISRWEYWPPWLTYLPVVGYVMWLALRHRSLTLFTAANPAMPAGGFVGESKFEILRGLAPSGDFIARSGPPPGIIFRQRVLSQLVL